MPFLGIFPGKKPRWKKPANPENHFIRLKFRKISQNASERPGLASFFPFLGFFLEKYPKMAMEKNPLEKKPRQKWKNTGQWHREGKIGGKFRIVEKLKFFVV